MTGLLHGGSQGKFRENPTKSAGKIILIANQEGTSGLLQHVLTVLVFWSWALLVPRLPPSSRSLRLFLCSSILPRAALEICLDMQPATPLPPVQKRDAQHKFLQHRGAHAERNAWNSSILRPDEAEVKLRLKRGRKEVNKRQI